jgi:hypothetical protein
VILQRRLESVFQMAYVAVLGSVKAACTIPGVVGVNTTAAGSGKGRMPAYADTRPAAADKRDVVPYVAVSA